MIMKRCGTRQHMKKPNTLIGSKLQHLLLQLARMLHQPEATDFDECRSRLEPKLVVVKLKIDHENMKPCEHLDVHASASQERALTQVPAPFCL